MAFKLSPPYKIDNTPRYEKKEEEGVLGRANKNGSITINDKVSSPAQINDIIKHEKVHLDQMKRGDLDYDDENVYWKGKAYPRSKMHEGAKNLPWEAEAYRKS